MPVLRGQPYPKVEQPTKLRLGRFFSTKGLKRVTLAQLVKRALEGGK